MMAAGWVPRIEGLIKRFGQELSDLKDKLAKQAQDQALANRPNPNDASGAIEDGYVTTAIGPRTGNTYGQGMAKRCVNKAGTITDLGADPVAVFNITGGTTAANVYIEMVRMPTGEYRQLVGDCAPGTYNGAAGSQPPQAQAAMQTQAGDTMTTQSGQTMTT